MPSHTPAERAKHGSDHDESDLEEMVRRRRKSESEFPGGPTDLEQAKLEGLDPNSEEFASLTGMIADRSRVARKTSPPHAVVISRGELRGLEQAESLTPKTASDAQLQELVSGGVPGSVSEQVGRMKAGGPDVEGASDEELQELVNEGAPGSVEEQTRRLRAGSAPEAIEPLDGGRVNMLGDIIVGVLGDVTGESATLEEVSGDQTEVPADLFTRLQDLAGLVSIAAKRIPEVARLVFDPATDATTNQGLIDMAGKLDSLSDPEILREVRQVASGPAPEPEAEPAPEQGSTREERLRTLAETAR